MAHRPELSLMSANQNIIASYLRIIIYLGWPNHYNTITQIITYIGLPRYHGIIPLNRLINHGIIEISYVTKVSWLETRPTEYAISTNSASPNYGGSVCRLSQWVPCPRDKPKELMDSTSESRPSQYRLHSELNAKAKELKPIRVPCMPMKASHQKAV